MPCVDGWLLDLYPRRDHIVLWFIAEGGQRLRLVDPFEPVLYVAPPDEAMLAPQEARRQMDRLARRIAAMPGIEPDGPAKRTDLWTGQPRPAWPLRVTDMDRYDVNLRELVRTAPDLAWFNCDIPAEIHYCYDRGLFPTARCRIDSDGDRLTACRLLDDPLDTAYTLPPRREVTLGAEGQLAGPRPRLTSISLDCDGWTRTWDEGHPADILRSLRDCLAEIDPDLIWTSGGDAALMPVLFEMSARLRVDLRLDREVGIDRRTGLKGRSYVSYGQVLYRSPDYPLFGRWHLDRDNSFWASETGLEGLIEVARMARMPVQRAARRSIGTGISSIELNEAYRNGTLIPWKKSQPEAWKSAATLLRTDRGGLVYQPLVGIYEDVAELDFASMYPSIMVRGNISPETINCPCCGPDTPGPEALASPAAVDSPFGEGFDGAIHDIGYHVCRRHRGLVPRSLEAIVAKRAHYKRLMREAGQQGAGGSLRGGVTREGFDSRQTALKWLLVCCFGYLGYRNARFGRIEAHEATCALSREKLLVARDVCERHGFEVLHAIVDCVWIRRVCPEGGEREPIAPDQIPDLIEAINAATGLTIALEGRYRWLAFLPSRTDPNLPVPNRYFGAMDGGKLTFRGIETRRSDQPPFVRRFQGDLLEALAEAPDLAACRAMEPQLLEMVSQAEARLAARDVPVEELVLKRKTSKAAGEYRNNAMTAVAARQAVRAGIELHPGQAVRFVVTSAGDADPDSRVRLLPLLGPDESYDPVFYIRLLRQAAATVLEPLLGHPLEPAADDTPARATPPRPTARRRAGQAGADIAQPDLFDGPAG